MSAAPEFESTQLRQHVIEAVNGVLRTAVAIEVQPVAGAPQAPPTGLADDEPEAPEGGTVAGLVRLTGEAEGLIALAFDAGFAAHCAAAAAGVTADRVGDTLVNETVGRLAAEVAARLGRTLGAAGCEITTGPAAILRGGNLCVEPLSYGEHLWQALACPQGRVAVDLMIRRAA